MTTFQRGDKVRASSQISGEIIAIFRRGGIEWAKIFTGEMYAREIPTANLTKEPAQ